MDTRTPQPQPNRWIEAKITWWLFAPGTWLFLDTGMMDFSIIRDQMLNETNEAETLTESFEAAAMVGTESLAITSDRCPDGSSSASVDIAPCVIGS